MPPNLKNVSGSIYMDMKTCHKCKVSKSLKNFPRNKTKADGRSEYCLVCKREYNRNHYRKNKIYYISKARRHKENVCLKLLRLKAEVGCKSCPERHPGCLQFHHRNPATKSFEISEAVLTKGWKTILKETKKCDVLCANCHFKLHFEINGRHWPPECDG